MSLSWYGFVENYQQINSYKICKIKILDYNNLYFISFIYHTMYISWTWFDPRNTPVMWLFLPIFIVFAACVAMCIYFSVGWQYYILIWVSFIVIIRILLDNKLKIIKMKKYKKNGNWELRKLEVTWIKKRSTKQYDEYYLEVKDGNTTYYSESYWGWKVWWVSIWFISDIYKKYWFEFDEKETHKQDVLRECDMHIEEKKYESENEGFFKKLLLKWKLILIENQRNIIEKWYQPQYWEVNWHRITVWDTVDVYFDPNNPENYRVDIDFLFDK